MRHVGIAIVVFAFLMTSGLGASEARDKSETLKASSLIGKKVQGTDGKKLGDIKDIILDKDGKVAAVILDVGAFLGVGGKYVAVGMNDLKITQDNNKPRFAVDMTKDQLKSAQAYELNPRSASTGTTTPPTGSTTPPANRPSTSTTTPATPPRQ